jgi:TonB family protein
MTARTQSTVLLLALLAPSFASHAWAQAPPPPDGDVPPTEASEPPAPVIVPPRAIEVPQAVYPAAALEAGVEAAVELLIDIDAEGKVTQVELKTLAGHGFDEAAVAAVRTMIFHPATVDGEPAPVRISYTYRFTIERKVVAPPPERPTRVVVRGEVVERGTRKRMAGVPILVAETGETVFSDSKGRYEIQAADPGRLTLRITLPSHLDFSKNVAFDGLAPAEFTLRITRDQYARYRTTIKREKLETEVAKKKITAAEIQKVPGNSGDAIKVVQALPGVARGSFGGSRPIVRGSNPRDTRVFLEGLELFQLFHFGGLYSVMNTDLLQAVDFWPGGFGAKYGEALGGLIELRLRPLETDRWHGVWETNLYHSGFLVEGPVGESGAFAAAARRSYIDVLLEAAVPADQLNFSVAPRYYDYQARYTHDFSNRSRLDVMVLGADDALELFLEEREGPSGQFFGSLGTYFDFHMGLMSWAWDPAADKHVHVSLGGGYTGFDIGLGDVFELDIAKYAIDLRTEYIWSPTKTFVMTAGAEAKFQPYEVAGYAPAPPKEGEQRTVPDFDDFIRFSEKGDLTVVASYLDVAWLATDTLTLNPGLRVANYQNSTGFSYLGVDPRFSLRWGVGDTTVLKSQVGIHRQPPFEDQQSQSVGNPALVEQKSWQVAAGVEQQIGDYVLADVQGFYKDMWDLVVSPDRESDVDLLSVSDGIGRVYGLEAIVRHDPSDRFFGWLSYTLMRAERRDGPDAAWRVFDYDQTHILTAVGVYRIGSGWEAGFRYRYTTGNPYDPIVSGLYDVDSDFFLPVYGGVNAERLPPFAQLDLRVDKKWVYDNWMLDLYIEMQNVTLHENIEAMGYTYDFRETRPVTGIPFLPNFGLKADF